MSNTCSEQELSRTAEGAVVRVSCKQDAVEGLCCCAQHAAERLEETRRRQKEVMARLKSRSEQLLELGIQLDLLKEDQRYDRTKAIDVCREVEMYVKAGIR